jgi:hypothetical protein
MFQVVVARLDSGGLYALLKTLGRRCLPHAILWIGPLNLVAGQSFGLQGMLYLARQDNVDTIQSNLV